MNTIQREQLTTQLKWRYATKQFDPTRRISPQDWEALSDAIVLTASSCGLQPWKFVVVTDNAMREKLLPATWGQRQVMDCSHFVIFASKANVAMKDLDELVDCIMEVRGVTRESLTGYRDMMIGALIKGLDDAGRKNWAAHQAYIALGNLLTSAALMGIDACPMEGFEPPKYDEILGLTKLGLTATVCCALGYRAASDKYASIKKVRFKKQDLLIPV